MASFSFNDGDSSDWPYADLELKTPHCPLCGSEARLLTGAWLHPSAWCENEACNALTWDPSVDRNTLLQNRVETLWSDQE